MHTPQGVLEFPTRNVLLRLCVSDMHLNTLKKCAHSSGCAGISHKKHTSMAMSFQHVFAYLKTSVYSPGVLEFLTRNVPSRVSLKNSLASDLQPQE